MLDSIDAATHRISAPLPCRGPAPHYVSITGNKEARLLLSSLTEVAGVKWVEVSKGYVGRMNKDCWEHLDPMLNFLRPSKCRGRKPYYVIITENEEAHLLCSWSVWWKYMDGNASIFLVIPHKQEVGRWSSFGAGVGIGNIFSCDQDSPTCWKFFAVADICIAAILYSISMLLAISRLRL